MSGKKKHILIIMILCFTLVTGCQSGKSSSQIDHDANSQTENIDLTDDKKIDDALKKYRKDRGNQKDSMVSGTILAKGVEGGAEAYGLGEADEKQNNLDSKELMEAFEIAEDYVNDTLKLDSEVYDCADPRILKIYNDKDKGIAKGYDKDNIYVLEYEEQDGTWSYLFLGKDGKGKPWKVLSHGKSYKQQ